MQSNILYALGVTLFIFLIFPIVATVSLVQTQALNKFLLAKIWLTLNHDIRV